MKVDSSKMVLFVFLFSAIFGFACHAEVRTGFDGGSNGIVISEDAEPGVFENDSAMAGSQLSDSKDDEIAKEPKGVVSEVSIQSVIPTIDTRTFSNIGNATFALG